MNRYDWLLIILLLLLLLLAFRSWHRKKKSNCAQGGCANCSRNAAHCPHKKSR